MITDAAANLVLDYYLGAVGFLPGTVYIGLMSALPNADGTGVVEPVGNAYNRVAVVNNAVQWPAAVARIKTHSADIVFPAATGVGWGLLTHVGIFDAASGGNVRLYQPLSIPRTVAPTDIFRFIAGNPSARLAIAA